MWGAKFPLEDWLQGSNAGRVYRRYLWMSRWVKGPTVLDVGCSHGSLVRFIADKNIESYVGCDINPKALRFARDKYKGDWVTFSRDLNEQPDGHFSTVVLGEVLEHQEFPASFLSFCKEKLAPDGVIIITVPHGIDEVSDHRQVFFTDTLERLIKQCDLSVLHWEYKDGEIFCVLHRGSWHTDYVGDAERNISEKLDRFISSYRVMERNYETIRGIRFLKWLKGLRK